ncbi:MAG: hypothetical protein A2Y62_02355, partial [Candidatus Fischerbacteria bacterium RBG_13_37_8]
MKKLKNFFSVEVIMGRYLITGGAGFIGSHIVEYLYKKSHKIRIVDNFSTGKWENIQEFTGKNVEVIEADIAWRNQLKGIMKDIEIVYHQAAIPSVPKSIKNPRATYRANVMGTLNILQAAKDAGVICVIFASSSSVYGTASNLPVYEDIPLKPISPYGASKLAGEHLCRVFSEIYQLNTICLRYFNVFGPRQDPKSQYAAVIPRFIDKMLKGQQPVIYGDGFQTRDFTYIMNVVKANILASACENNGEGIFNIASSSSRSINELVALLNTLLKTNIPPRYIKERANEP